MTDLPIFLGIPSAIRMLLIRFCIEWQVGLFHFMNCHALTPKTMNVKAIPYFFKWYQMELTDERKEAVEHYLTILRRLKVEQPDENIARTTTF